jgi:ATP-dependent helicase/nuclease subunit B
MTRERPRVFTIPPGVPFLPALVDALLDGTLIGALPAGPFGLSDITIFVPTRRAARALLALLADQGDGGARLLPRIVPLGEADEAEFALSGLDGLPLAEDGALLPSIPPLERRLILTQLVQRWAHELDRTRLKMPDGEALLIPSSPSDAVMLAGDLEALMDAFTTEGIDWQALENAVDGDYSEFFRLTREFISIVSTFWPAILEERAASDPARRRTALVSAEAQRLVRDRPDSPMIVAGSTGSVPSTASLIAAIARLPNGAVVLPGLDLDLDETSWTLVGGRGGDETDPVHSHPQAALRRLLDRHLQMTRPDVIPLGRPAATAFARNRMLSEALRPAETTDRWSLIPEDERQALAATACSGIAIVEAADEREEALAVALALRETLATPGRTAALVTPDRSLAARVAAELARWNLGVEDSAGIPLSETPAGRLARLAADMAADGISPLSLLALLAHPLVCLGWHREMVQKAAAVLEIGVLRGPAPGPGFAGIRLALDLARSGEDRHAPRPKKRLTQADWDLAAQLLDRLEEAFTGFPPEDADTSDIDLMSLPEVHAKVMAALTCDDEGRAQNEDGQEALGALFDDLKHSHIRDRDGRTLSGRFADYPAFFTALAKQQALSPTQKNTHRRVKILGLLEARLLDMDRVVLSGLDEGTWPPRTVTDAFLNRPMRDRVGLTPPERRIGQTAHDFAQALGAGDVVITRAHKREGSPMVPSRFLQRVKAFAGENAWRAMRAAGDRYCDLARHLDTPVPAPLLKRPAPVADPARFPRSLSVTEIETLVRDPYSIYARYVLKLDKLEAVAVPPGAAERGTIIHEVLGNFAKAFPTGLPANILERLLESGRQEFDKTLAGRPDLDAEWWPRFVRIAAEFGRWETERRPELKEVHAERYGQLAIPLADGTAFLLRARADRIEERRDGGFAIIDFKTGMPPGNKEVYAGFAPQLTLEAMMLMEGAFKDAPRARTAPDLVYIRTSGGRNAMETRVVGPTRSETRSVDEVVEEHRRRFIGMIHRFTKGEGRYVSRPFPKFARRFSEYDHLARVKEWSQAGDDEASE